MKNQVSNQNKNDAIECNVKNSMKTVASIQLVSLIMMKLKRLILRLGRKQLYQP